jgi:hypothetical protein
MEPQQARKVLLQYGDDMEGARAALERERAAFEAMWPELQDRWKVPLQEGAWCPAQVVEHVLKASTGFSKVLYLLRRDAPLPDVPKVPGTYKGGRPQAPDSAIPGDPQPFEALEPTWREVHDRLLKEAVVAQPSERTFFHPFMGDLDALGWVRMSAYHLAHHRKQLMG